MTTKKYQFYIDTKKQDNFLSKKVFAKKVHPNYLPFIKNKNIDNLMTVLTEYRLNTHNEFFKNFCKENDINENIYIKIFRSYKEVVIALWKFENIDDLPAETIFKSQIEGFFSLYYENSLNEQNPYFIKLEEDAITTEYKKQINFKENFIVSKNILDNTTKDLKYRIYIDDRMLIERFFPKDLMISKVVCEECYLNLNQPTKIKLVTANDLVFSKLVSTNNINYPNSTEFILEP